MGGTSQYSMGFIRVVEDILSSVDCHDGSGMYLRYVIGYHYRCEGFYNSRVKTINTMEGFQFRYRVTFSIDLMLQSGFSLRGLHL